MTTVPDIPVVQLPALDADGVSGLGGLTAPGSIWAVDVPSTRRLTPVTLAALGVVAGIAAMALGHGRGRVRRLLVLSPPRRR